MGVTHMLSFSQNDERLWLKLARTPDGPTLTFRVRQFTLRRHIVRTQRRPVSLHTPALHANPPIVVTNNFESGAGGAAPSASRPHLKLLRITFQNLFPATNVHTVKLRECKRLALFHYDPEADLVQVRHYAITSSLRDAAALAAAATAAASPSSSGGGGAAAAGQRRLRRIVSSRSKLPNLSRLSDIADLLDDGAAVSDGAATSDSELEDEGGDDDDGGSASAAAPASASPSLASSSSSSALSRAVKLKEVGPRLTLQLVKVERGLAGGDVLYHAHERRSADEAARLRERKEREARGREERRAAQRANVDRKRAAADERRLAKKQRRQGRGDPGPSTALPHGEGQEEDEEGSEAGSSPEEGGEGYGSEEGARAPSSDEEYEGSDEGQE
jgi:ribosome biogenesis protein SSF1/2